MKNAAKFFLGLGIVISVVSFFASFFMYILYQQKDFADWLFILYPLVAIIFFAFAHTDYLRERYESSFWLSFAAILPVLIYVLVAAIRAII